MHHLLDSSCNFPATSLSSHHILQMQLRHKTRRINWDSSNIFRPLNVGFCKLESSKLHCFETDPQSSLRPHPQEPR